MSAAEVALRSAIAGAGGFAFVGIWLVVLNWLERKMGGRIQSRHGPLHVGFHGILQTFADLFKLMQKEYIIPRGADRFLFLLAPFMFLVPAVIVFLVIPVNGRVVAVDIPYALLFALAFPALGSFGILAAGWASNSKYSLLASIRTIGQMLSYEVPRTLSALSVVMLAGSLSLIDIVNHQQAVWFVLVQPVAFLIFFFASLAESNRMPFDFTWAESELVSGFFTEYTGMRWALFFLGEYGALVANCTLTAVLFFGGWLGPSFLPGIVWFLIKVAALILFSLWVRWTWPRFRIDQWMNFSWKFLLPLSIINLLITAALMLWLKVGV